jgi:hypothetical protein
MNFPPPWNLTGEGIIIPFYANKKYFLDSNYLSEEDKKIYNGGLGAIMLVNYETSNVGPYFELLLIPGDFEFQKKTYKRITKIFVSNEVSVKEGIKNWAIPKEFANFTWEKNSNETKIEIKTNEIFFKLSYESLFFSFPVTTSIYPVELLQPNENQFLITKFTGKGSGKFAKINSIYTNEKNFPNIKNGSKIHFGLSVSQFQIQFPVPKIIL